MSLIFFCFLNHPSDCIKSKIIKNILFISICIISFLIKFHILQYFCLLTSSNLFSPYHSCNYFKESIYKESLSGGQPSSSRRECLALKLSPSRYIKFPYDWWLLTPPTNNEAEGGGGVLELFSYIGSGKGGMPCKVCNNKGHGKSYSIKTNQKPVFVRMTGRFQ